MYMKHKKRHAKPFMAIIQNVGALGIIFLALQLIAGPPLWSKETAGVESLNTLPEKRTGRTEALLNLREGPSLSHAVVVVLDAGTVLDIQEEADAWLKVKAGNLNGWVFAEYVRITSPGKYPDRAEPVGPASLEPDPVVNDGDSHETGLTMNFYQSDIREILSGLAMQQQINIVTSPEVSGKISVHLYQVSFEVALESVCQAGGFGFYKQRDVYYVFKPKVAQEPLAESFSMRIFKIEYAEMDKIQEILTAIPNIRMVKIHEPSKTIIVEDTAENIAKIETLIRFWDTRPKQVMIEAKILEVSLTDDMVLGVNWAQILGDVRLGTGGFSTATLPGQTGISPVPETGSGIFMNMVTGAGTGRQFAAALDALQDKTKINTLSAPKILAIHSKPARVQVGGQQGYTVTTVSDGIATTSVEFIDTGTILEITPFIDNENNVLLEVQPTINAARIEEGIPVVSSTKVQTWLMAKNGETVFIGGLIQNRGTETREGIPFLSDIPGLGLLFSRSVKGTGKSELIVLITPRVIEEGALVSPDALEKTMEVEKQFGFSESELNVN
jgi:type IV pilus secretin PilQ/predicted competence protein